MGLWWLEPAGLMVGAGDNLMATGIACGAAARGKRIAFGDGRKIIWDQHSEMVFRGNPNIAPRGSEGSSDLEWIEHYKGRRLYNHREGNRWIWHQDFRVTPGEMFFSPDELEFGRRQGSGFIVIEPHVPAFKACAPNKQWPRDRYEKVARYLVKSGREVRQFDYGVGQLMPYVTGIKTPSFRHALAVLARTTLYIGPEGGLHHGAAAVGVSAVVLFGGFIPPSVTGYASHANLTGGAEACGSLNRCRHCITAMEKITVNDVHEAALGFLCG